MCSYHFLIKQELILTSESTGISSRNRIKVTGADAKYCFFYAVDRRLACPASVGVQKQSKTCFIVIHTINRTLEGYMDM